MVTHTTREDFKRFERELSTEERKSITRRAAERSPRGSTFLSHSSADIEILPGAIKLLENHGAFVYIDKMDQSLPSNTSRETAVALRERIEVCHKFILFATQACKESRWVPWELGIADGLKRPHNTAILPALDLSTETRWLEQEYLGIYDRIVWGDLKGYDQKVWMVWNQEANTARPLKDWLQS